MVSSIMNLRAICLLATFCLVSGVLAADQRFRLAFAQDTMANDFRKAQVFEVRDQAAKYPELEFVYSDAQGRVSLLIRQIERFLLQGVNLLIVGTNDEAAVVPVIAKAHERGIPVIILDRGIQGEAYTTFIHSDNYRIGRLGAEYLAGRLAGQGRVLLFEGLPNADVTRLRSQGFLDEMAKHPGIEVIRRTGNYLRKDAIVEMEQVLADGLHLDGIFSESDSMLSGARLVLQRHGLDPGAMVSVGVDYISEARQAIRAGTQSASVRFPLGGRESVEVARRILRGESVPRHIEIPVELVTRENVEQVAPIF